MINFKIKKLFYLPALTLLSSLLLSGCLFGGGDGPGGCNSLSWATDLGDELMAVSTAASTYSQNRTEANCDNYQQALRNYVNALRPYGDCQGLTGQSRRDWQEMIDDFEEDLEQSDCEDL
ncbi:MAG: hypothetical protein WD431_03640 [Cyclobacteriaceae bacterium]